MSAQIIDGSKLASQIHEQISKQVQERIAQGLSRPGLAVVLVGEDPASKVYVRNKHRACEKTGIYSRQIELSEKTTQKELLKIVDDLNSDPEIHGILVQFPLPKHLDPKEIIERIHPKKDVDGFHPYNVGRLVQGMPTLRPCTPYGVIKMLESTGVDLTGKDAIMVGASTVVGRPMLLELLLKNCTVTICHKATQNLSEKIRRSEVVVVAIGNPEFIKGEWIKEGAIVIDVGINRLPDGRLVGDIEFDVAKERASFITPVPGGVGPMTIAMLLVNTLEAAKMLDE
ncbi:MAG: bifunctional methylenetetrahydrofolate dehydrogenase/methenyltetrahydrofolate cyclohydrolase FolD [Gammaproteobacteria bacterium]|nr:bifunctional methylenetetrahydrofolate dehydrogenase/methenyltetrahydrofolate cyclohydrolase FolD [Gammaproteobacteria bacterium]